MITGAELKAEVIKICEQYPNAIYDSSYGCGYDYGIVKNGPSEEGCLLGQAVRKLSIDVFKEFCCLSDSIESVIDELKIKCTDDEKNWLINVQQAQDFGRTWSEAMKDANENIELSIDNG